MQNVHEDVSLAPLTTFGIGGDARYAVDIRSEDELLEALEWSRQKGTPFVVLAGGSNVLVPDRGVEGLVICMKGNLYGAQEGAVDSWCGTNLLFLIETLGKQGWGGWERLAGIPGSVGGAVRGNAGAFGSEIQDFVSRVRAVNSASGESRTFSRTECNFSYRHSFFKDHPEWIITRVALQLKKVGPAESERLSKETIGEREKRHLQNVRAAGSFFMNPVAPPEVVAMFEKEKKVKSREGRVPAGWLIEKTGLKGAKVGGAIASLQHPNYIVNQGGASSSDVLALAAQIKEEVSKHFGVRLSEEAALFPGLT